MVPEIYARYIDDIILGPLNRNSPLNLQILQAFNSINTDIKFTLEVPVIGKPLNFLDLSIYVDRTGFSYTWYSKDCHSQNTLKPDGSVPKHVKINFLSNSVRAKICSNKEMKDRAPNKLNERFKLNGYRDVNFGKF